MTIGQIKEATCSSTTNACKFEPFINEACEKFEINTPIRQLCFLAQVGHESGSLFFTEELASGAAYEGRKNLGNTKKGDGVRYKGRGLIQITGRSNYKSVSDALGIDFIKSPELLGGKNANKCTQDQLKNAVMSAAWFWDTRKLNAIADSINIAKPIDTGKNLEQFILLTKKINGGTNGLQDRINRYRTGLNFFTIEQAKQPVAKPAIQKTTTHTYLQKGDNGNAVKSLQQALNNNGASPKLLEDGDYGNGTVKAIKAFQLKQHLFVDGVAGPSTLLALGVSL